MKVYIPIPKSDPHEMPNPFICTLTDFIQKENNDVFFEFGLELFWSDNCEKFDIIHFMWPEVFEDAILNGFDFKGRLDNLKEKGIKIISTCHNLQAHIKRTIYSESLYNWVYEASDCIVHLGKYSQDLLQKKFPTPKHIIISHHVYDTIYTKSVDKTGGLNHLGLSSKYTYILCLGAFRTMEEKDLIKNVASVLHNDNVRIIAPNIMKFPVGRKNPKLWINALFEWIKYKLKYDIYVKGRYISDDDLYYYFAASDIILIQRVKILNSGNLPLGLYMGKIVVGPNEGNVGLLLKETNNPIFDSKDFSTVIESIRTAIKLKDTALGENNRKFSIDNFQTSKISNQYLFAYKSLLDNNL